LRRASPASIQTVERSHHARAPAGSPAALGHQAQHVPLAVGEIEPEKAICMATGNVGRAHDLNIGILEEGRPADLVLMHKITGSVAKDALDSFAKGDLPGISYVIIDGIVQVAGRSQQTPPPERVASQSCC
jgi:imidazolonepropionase-like amidohydrolase